MIVFGSLYAKSFMRSMPQKPSAPGERNTEVSKPLKEDPWHKQSDFPTVSARLRGNILKKMIKAPTQTYLHQHRISRRWSFPEVTTWPVVEFRITFNSTIYRRSSELALTKTTNTFPFYLTLHFPSIAMIQEMQNAIFETSSWFDECTGR